ncbi:MAG: PTS sugar transporter subunit IIC [Ruminococcaceae bacterium]|nr:PTS sugar transporter subunit IIC [Oscillospiraceae bacterium]
MAYAKSDGQKGFFERKNLNISAKVYFIDAMGAMAFGLFASLLIGTIFNTVGQWTDISFFRTMAIFAKAATGAAIGVAVAHTLKAPPLVLYTCAAVGFAGYCYNGAEIDIAAIGTGSGNPIGAFVAVLVACELGKVISKETKLDIILTPTVTLASGTAVAVWLAPWLGKMMDAVGNLVKIAMDEQPLLMSIAVSVIVGILLTLPISSAAICAAIAISGLAGGAAAAGCCAQMVGFAVMSFPDNGWSGLTAQGIGTSMLQMPNIVRRPFIWLPPIIVSAVNGPIATLVFGLECNGVSAGMGTCGFVGPLGMLEASSHTWWTYVGIIVVSFVIPAVLTPIVAVPFRKLDIIREGDLKLEKGM